MADQLGQLVLQGIKTATTSLKAQYEKDGEPLPKVGDQSIILDSKNRQLCQIEITDVTVMPFSQVDEDFAIAEGEGDLSLSYWREAHINFFSQYCDFHEEMEVVLEKFKVIKKF